MLRLTYHATTTIPVEAECLTPDHLAQKSLSEILALPLQHGNTQVALGEFFSAEGSAEDGNLVIEGECSRVKWIGAGMTTGSITVYGNVGMHLGAEMRGGEIRVHGNASDWVGAEMRGGLIRVHGQAGHLVGAGYRGSHIGMRNGIILIDGKAGNEIGSGLRRGLIAIGGDTGDYPGVGMIAGSIFIRGTPGIRAGAGMKRGTLVFLGPAPQLLSTFRKTCRYRPVFLLLYLRQLREWGWSVEEQLFHGEWSRYAGDLVSLGKGEALVFERES